MADAPITAERLLDELLEALAPVDVTKLTDAELEALAGGLDERTRARLAALSDEQLEAMVRGDAHGAR